MQVLEKILEEIDREIYKQREICNEVLDTPGYRLYERTMKRAKDIVERHIDDAKDENIHSNDDLISRKTLKEEIESLRMKINGMRNGKTMTIKALEEYKKSVLRIIDEQPTVYVNDDWIPVEDGLPEDREEVEVTIEEKADEDGGKRYYTARSWLQDGRWIIRRNPYEPRVTAWQPLPEPYKSKKDISAAENIL